MTWCSPCSRLVPAARWIVGAKAAGWGPSTVWLQWMRTNVCVQEIAVNVKCVQKTVDCNNQAVIVENKRNFLLIRRKNAACAHGVADKRRNFRLCFGCRVARFGLKAEHLIYAENFMDRNDVGRGYADRWFPIIMFANNGMPAAPIL